MMHGRGKSDSAIVAGKSANKAERSAAELMERRAGAKGNVDQQTTCRAQNRESVSQALERIRQAARQRKKERFTSLLHHVNVDLLRLAFFELKRNAAPGVDGLTWQDYEADLELRLDGSACTSPTGSISGTAIATTVHTEAGWPTASARCRCAGGQDCPTGSGSGVERDLRGRLPRVLVRVPTEARTARCAGCPCRRDHTKR